MNVATGYAIMPELVAGIHAFFQGELRVVGRGQPGHDAMEDAE